MVIHDPADSRLDVFYDETPRTHMRFLLKVSNHNNPLVLNFTELLDGTAVENKAKMDHLKKLAQVQMLNVLRRLQASDDCAEFERWWMEDADGVKLFESKELTVEIKQTVGSHRAK